MRSLKRLAVLIYRDARCMQISSVCCCMYETPKLEHLEVMQARSQSRRSARHRIDYFIGAVAQFQHGSLTCHAGIMSRPSPRHSRQNSAISTTSVIRSSSTSHSPSPAASPVSPTDGLSRRLSWNRPINEATLSVQNAHAVLDGHVGLGVGPIFVDQAEERDIVSYTEPQYPPRTYFTEYTNQSQGSVNSSTSDIDSPPENEQDGERLTFAPPTAGSAHRRVPSRAYDEQGNPRNASMSARVAGAVRRNPTLRNVSRTLRQASVRVVNIMGSEGKGRKLDDQDVTLVEEPEEVQEEPEEVQPTRPGPMPPEVNKPLAEPGGRLRGKTLGVFGPTSKIRIAMDRLLRFP